MKRNTATKINSATLARLQKQYQRLREIAEELAKGIDALATEISRAAVYDTLLAAAEQIRPMADKDDVGEKEVLPVQTPRMSIPTGDSQLTDDLELSLLSDEEETDL